MASGYEVKSEPQNIEQGMKNAEGEDERK